jgi:hypothetical protein
VAVTAFDDPRPIRVMVFPSRPDVLLIYVPEGEELWLPRMRSPFARHDVAMKLGEVDIPARVSESVPGRFTHAVEQAINAARSERNQRQREEEAARIATVIANPDATDLDKERAQLLAEKQEVDDRIRKFKADVGSAKAAAVTKGEYLPPAKFRQLNDRLAQDQARSLAIQRRLSEIKKERKAENITQHADRDRRFIELVKQVLPREQLQDLWDQIDAEECMIDHEIAMRPSTHVLWGGRVLCEDLRLCGVPRDWPAAQRWISLKDVADGVEAPTDRCEVCWNKVPGAVEDLRQSGTNR